MAGFNATSFIYDGIPGDKYGLYIAEIDGSNVKEATAETNVIKSIKAPKGYESTFLGYEEVTPLTFEIKIMSEKEIPAPMIGNILKWLVARNGYKKFILIQGDMSHIFYECIFINPVKQLIGNSVYGFTVTGECNSPYQFSKEITVTRGSSSASYDLMINNASDINDYVYPYLEFKMPASGNQFTITNNSDNGRKMIFSPLAGNEHMTVDNKRKIITSSQGISRMASFNKKWLRLISGVNNLTVSPCASLKIVVPQIRRVGG